MARARLQNVDCYYSLRRPLTGKMKTRGRPLRQASASGGVRPEALADIVGWETSSGGKSLATRLNTRDTYPLSMERIAVAREGRETGSSRREEPAVRETSRWATPHPNVEQACSDSSLRGSRGVRASVSVQRSTSSVQRPAGASMHEHGRARRLHAQEARRTTHEDADADARHRSRSIGTPQGPAGAPLSLCGADHYRIIHYRAHRPASSCSGSGSGTLALGSVDPLPAPSPETRPHWLLGCDRPARRGGGVSEGKINGKVVSCVVEGSSYDL